MAEEKTLWTRTLRDLPEGAVGKVLGVRGSGLLARRLTDLGFVPGARVTVRGIGPLGDPMAVQLRGKVIALRKIDAKRIGIEE